MEPRDILGIILLLIQASIIIPLIIELRTTRSSSGISILSETAWIIAGTGWSLYGYLTGSTTLIVSGALATLGSALVYYFVYEDIDTMTKQRSVIVSVVFTIIMLLSTMIFHAAGLAIFLSIFGLIQFIPQMITSLKSIKHELPPLLRCCAWKWWFLVSQRDFPLIVRVSCFFTQSYHSNHQSLKIGGIIED